MGAAQITTLKVPGSQTGMGCPRMRMSNGCWQKNRIGAEADSGSIVQAGTSFKCCSVKPGDSVKVTLKVPSDAEGSFGNHGEGSVGSGAGLAANDGRLPLAAAKKTKFQVQNGKLAKNSE